jgi:hypothetical protein
MVAYLCAPLLVRDCSPHAAQDIQERRVPPPFRPALQSDVDVSNFDPEFTHSEVCITPPDGSVLIVDEDGVEQRAGREFEVCTCMRHPWEH